jgi:hypothetical protein
VSDPAVSPVATVFNVADLPERFQRRILIRDDGCWEWTGQRKKIGGYGLVSWNGRTAKAHRAVFGLLVGQVPPDLPELDHTCHRPEICAAGDACPHRPCVNPAHLEPVTSAENMRRARLNHRGRQVTHCPQGHAYDEKNTLLRRGANGLRRDCRACSRERNRWANLTPEQQERKNACERERRRGLRGSAT